MMRPGGPVDWSSRPQRSSTTVVSADVDEVRPVETGEALKQKETPRRRRHDSASLVQTDSATSGRMRQRRGRTVDRSLNSRK